MRKSLILIFLITSLASPAYAGWTPEARISGEALAYDPKIVATESTLHVVYWRGGAFTSCYYLRLSDSGDSWSEPFHLADTTYTSNNVAPVIRSEDNNIAAIWRGSLREGGHLWNYGFRLSTDEGATWNEIAYVLPTDNFTLQKHTYFISSSTLFLIYSRIAQQEIVVEFTKSTDWGETWTTPTEVFRTQETGPIDMVAKGDTIHFAWVGRFDYNQDWETYYIKSEDGGDSWGDSMLLSTLDTRGSNWPSISQNSRGDIIVGWMDYKYSPFLITGDIFVRYSFDAGNSWTEEEQLTSHHLVFPLRVLWSGDSIHVAWEDWRYDQQDIFYSLSKDNGMTWGEDQRVEDDPGESGYPDLAYNGNSVHLVWNDFREDPGYGIYYSRWEEEVGTDDGDVRLPDKLNMAAYPNPFNSSTIITYNKLKGGEIEIYNIVGQKIQTLKTTEKEGKIIWDARDALGNKVSSGIYFARVRGTINYSTMKLIYLK